MMRPPDGCRRKVLPQSAPIYMIYIHCDTRRELGDAWRALRQQTAVDEATVCLQGQPIWTAVRTDVGRWSTRRGAHQDPVIPAPAP